MWLKQFISKLKNIVKWLKNKIQKSPLYGRTLIVFFFMAFIVKIFVVYFSYRHLDPINSCLSYISSDIIVLFLAQLLVTINFWIKTRKYRLFNDFLVFALLVIYCIDIFVIFYFQSRASIFEAFMI